MKYRCIKCGCLLRGRMCGTNAMIIQTADGLCDFCSIMSESKSKQNEPLTLYNAPVGTIIYVDETSYQCKILATLNEGLDRVLLLSWHKDHKKSADWQTAKELEENGWKVVQPKPKCKECGRELE